MWRYVAAGVASFCQSISIFAPAGMNLNVGILEIALVTDPIDCELHDGIHVGWEDKGRTEVGSLENIFHGSNWF